MPAEDFETAPGEPPTPPPAAAGQLVLAIPIADENSSRELIAALRDPMGSQLFDLTLTRVILKELPNLEVTVDGMTMHMVVEAEAVTVIRCGA
jgi:hypothetical protein